jgi:hypothetical protein
VATALYIRMGRVVVTRRAGSPEEGIGRAHGGALATAPACAAF